VNRITRVILSVVLLPFRLVQTVIRLIDRGLGWLLAPVFQQLDASSQLSSMVNSLSSSMATQRGLPLLIGTGLLLISLVAHGLVLAIMVSSDEFGRNLYWLCIPFTLLHVGVLAGFTGAMLAIPLGQGYKDK
jgi:hypothetical protein